MDEPQASGINRRSFLEGLAAVTAAGATGFVPGLGRTVEAQTLVEGTVTGSRRDQAFQIRVNAAKAQRNTPDARHPNNGDEKLYEKKINSFSKCLPHNELGEVNKDAYAAYVDAVKNRNVAQMNAIPRGGVGKFANPQAAFAFNLEGADSHQLSMAAPPAFSSARQAAEMAELYWRALLRDVPFAEFETDSMAQAAAMSLSGFSGYAGPRDGNAVTPAVLFRGGFPGDLTGPFVSQFLVQSIPFGAKVVNQKYRTTAPGDDHMTSYNEWLSIQNGAAPTGANAFDSTFRYIRSGRDLAEYVHRDFSYQAFLNAGLILGGMRAPSDAANPYLHYATTSSFATFGGPYALDMIARVACASLKAAWFQKWLVHRRARPEEFAGRIQNHVTGKAHYPIHPDLLNRPGSTVLDAVFSKHGSYLLPMAYPEGCPTHPSFPAGHAAISGACATVLKALFDEDFVIPKPVVAASDGISLKRYSGTPLTVGGELNKLAANIALARDTSGVHWRSDGIQGILLGEAFALSILSDMRATFSEPFDGFSLTKFDGQKIVI